MPRRLRDDRSRGDYEIGGMYKILVEKDIEYRCHNKDEVLVIIPKREEVKVTVFEQPRLIELLYF